MKSLKRYFGVWLSVVLLAGFSVTLIPLDLFHSHQYTQSSCQDETGRSCNHKVHISSKAEFCWACAVHFDKTFTKTSFVERLKLSPTVALFINNDAAAYIFERIFVGLRGPPAE